FAIFCALLFVVQVWRCGKHQKHINYPPPAEAPASPPNSEPAAAPQRRPKKDPSGCSVLLFPGQGSQFVGMGRGLLKYPNVKEMFTVLQKTVHCQPAVFVTSLAAVERLNQENPKAIEMCVAAAGFSVGEFAALVFSGAMNFAEALYAMKVRAETMQKASELVPSGMLSVTGRPQAQYNYACLLQAKEHCKSLGMENPVCSVLLLSFLLSSLTSQALDFLQENSRRLKFMRTKTLPVSGAFHTELMASATEPVREVLRQVEVSQPLYPKGINIFSETCIQLLYSPCGRQRRQNRSGGRPCGRRRLQSGTGGRAPRTLQRRRGRAGWALQNPQRTRQVAAWKPRSAGWAHPSFQPELM
uniref:Malonyl-CoA-acyl carrier protein transacylase n=1 Tax=Maylandia zebra TaxID=106582 RepID=A0A3P9B8I9_9CICH